MHKTYDEYTAASSHNQRLQDEEKQSKKTARKSKRTALLFLIIVSSLLTSLIIWHRVIETISPQTPISESTSSAVSSSLPPIDGDSVTPPWNLTLVSLEHLLPEDYSVTLAPLAGQRFDYRVRDPLSRMIVAAANDDVTLIVCSGYRSVSQQNRLYSRHMAEYQADGLSETEAKNKTEQLVQYPGASEHHTGLAVDFSDQHHSELTEEFSSTSAYDWLCDHAAEFGFVERYPADKTSITGISWEPWHYRYVGSEHAKYMQSSSLCLEEYLELQFPTGES